MVNRLSRQFVVDKNVGQAVAQTQAEVADQLKLRARDQVAVRQLADDLTDYWRNSAKQQKRLHNQLCGEKYEVDKRLSWWEVWRSRVQGRAPHGFRKKLQGYARRPLKAFADCRAGGQCLPWALYCDNSSSAPAFPRSKPQHLRAALLRGPNCEHVTPK